MCFFRLFDDDDGWLWQRRTADEGENGKNSSSRTVVDSEAVYKIMEGRRWATKLKVEGMGRLSEGGEAEVWG
jgi:hypothetical protein